MSELIDNRAARVRTMKDLIRSLHAGESPETIKARFRELIHGADYSEVVAMEQDLLAEGMPVTELTSMCDLHSQIMRDTLVQLAPPSVPPGHPVDTFRRENEALRGAILRARVAIKQNHDLDWRTAYNELADVEKHYQRKEHTLFSKLEAHGITGPSKVMWAKDDEVRALFKTALEDRNEAARLVAAIEEMIFKEENILLPMALNTLTDEDWANIWMASPRYGWCLVEPLDGYRPPEAVVREGLKLTTGQGVQLPTGNLTIEQLTAIFSTLPVDITFVDADDRVAFFSEGPDRVFARSRAILGRKVQNCHPPRSVDVVDRILGDFRSGRQSIAEFWLNFHGRFVHVRYFAVRDSDQSYLGTLEVTQDLTHPRSLQGERRLLEYDGAPADTTAAAPPPAEATPQPPTPVEPEPAIETIDADALLKSGEHPVGRIRAAFAALAPGATLRLTASFRPDPLIDLMRSSGAQVTVLEPHPGRFVVEFTKA